MTICNTCTLNLIDAKRVSAKTRTSTRQINERLAPKARISAERREYVISSGCCYEDIGRGQACAARVVNPLNGADSVAAFYGCHITRPPERYGFIDFRNNRSLEQLSELLGCKPIDYTGRTECCGFHTAAHDERIAIKLTGQHIESAKSTARRRW